MAMNGERATGGHLLLDDTGGSHLLHGEVVSDGDLLDVLTDGGWVSGHYRALLHPETGLPAFELHLGTFEEPSDAMRLEHAVIHLPQAAVVRRHHPPR